MTDLINLVSRLEKAVERLEKMNVSGPAIAAIMNGGASSSAAASGAAPPPATPVVVAEEVAPFVAAFDAYLEESVNPFYELSAKLGPDTQAAADAVKKALTVHRAVLVAASKCKKPTAPADLQKLLTPTGEVLAAANELKNKRGTFFNHVSGVVEGLQVLYWVVQEKTPCPFIKEMMGAGDFYLNKVLTEYKNKDAQHVDFVKSYKEVLGGLERYVKQYHITGTAWNAKGQELSTYKADAPAAAPAAAPRSGPPPPPPAPVNFVAEVAAANAAASSAAAKPAGGNSLFAELSKGEAVTSGLRHVTKDMKTKNQDPSARSSVVPASTPAPSAAAKPAAGAAANKFNGTARIELEGKKWQVEYQKGNSSIIIDDTNMKQTVYIYRCRDSVIQIKGKINNVVMDDCLKCGVVFDNAVACCEIVNCNSVQVQVTGRVPSIAVDKCGGIQLFLSKECMDAEIVTAKSSEMNICVPQEGDDGDIVEIPIPEQYVTKWNAATKKFVTNISSHV